MVHNTQELCSCNSDFEYRVWQLGEILLENRCYGIRILKLGFLLSCGFYRPPLWSSGQSSWLQIRRPGSDSRYYQIFRQKKKKENK
jgi:hypothetical protein